MRKIAVIGAGMGGLTSAIRLQQKGFQVSVFEAGGRPGGLASGVQVDGIDFDGGPYILLDRPGLEWAFQQLNLSLDERVPMKRIEQVYDVSSTEHSQRIRIFHSLDKTREDLEATQSGSGDLYVRFVSRMRDIYHRLSGLQRQSEPNVWKLISQGAWRDIPFLLKPLHRVIRDAGINGNLKDALGIWTHVAGQQLTEAPSPLALVPAVIHEYGCFLPINGIREVPTVLASHAQELGVAFHYGAKVSRIQIKNQAAVGVQLANGDYYPSDAVISNASGVGTYTDLIGATNSETEKLRALPLQSPGFCVYLLCKGRRPEFYLRFHLQGDSCRLFISPESVLSHSSREWWPARLIQPLKHGSQAAENPQTQQTIIADLLKQSWWRPDITDFRVVKIRTTRD